LPSLKQISTTLFSNVRFLIALEVLSNGYADLIYLELYLNNIIIITQLLSCSTHYTFINVIDLFFAIML